MNKMENIKKLSLTKGVFFVGLTLLMATLSTSSWAQRGKTWRCPGNVYTNNATEIKKYGACTEVTSQITITSPAPGGQRSQTTALTRTSSGSPSSGASQTPSAMKIDASDQNKRNVGARQIIERELQQKQVELAALQREYNNGQPNRYTSEMNDTASYEARAQRLSQQIGIKLDEIGSIQKELDRM